jgi:hypothetical protein
VERVFALLDSSFEVGKTVSFFEQVGDLLHVPAISL